MTEVYLQAGKEKVLKTRHPWVFSGAIRGGKTAAGDGELVRLLNHEGKFLAVGHFQQSSIALRLLGFEDVKPDSSFFEAKVRDAIQYRLKLGLINDPKTNCFRLINGEGDRLPGLIIDYYNGLLVCQFHSTGMYNQRKAIFEALNSVDSLAIDSIYQTGSGFSGDQIAQLEKGLIQGVRGEVEVLEHGIKFLVNPAKGQKTGFFLDQRDNRNLVKSLSEGKKILNAFSYTGGFSMAALDGGASEVVSVDSSAYATSCCEIHTQLNLYNERKHTVHTEDVYKFLSEGNESFDVVILDPPAFAKSRRKSHNAVQAYKRLMIMGLSRLKKGGLLLTFSCSQVVGRQLFEDTVRAAAIESSRPMRIIKQLGPGADHPVNIFHNEGHYLKGFLLEA